MFFVMAGLWGIADAVWLVQINGTLPAIVTAGEGMQHVERAEGNLHALRCNR